MLCSTCLRLFLELPLMEKLETLYEPTIIPHHTSISGLRDLALAHCYICHYLWLKIPLESKQALVANSSSMEYLTKLEMSLTKQSISGISLGIFWPGLSVHDSLKTLPSEKRRFWPLNILQHGGAGIFEANNE